MDNLINYATLTKDLDPDLVIKPDIEIMDDPFLNSIEKVVHMKKEIHSPWLQAYPDLGNINAWPENDIGSDLENNIDAIAAIHLKDTLPEDKYQFIRNGYYTTDKNSKGDNLIFNLTVGLKSSYNA